MQGPSCYEYNTRKSPCISGQIVPHTIAHMFPAGVPTLYSWKLHERYRCFSLPVLLQQNTQASDGKNLTLVIPSEYLALGVYFSFGLTVTTDLGGSGEASVTVFKSTQELPLLKVGARNNLSQKIPDATGYNANMSAFS